MRVYKSTPKFSTLNYIKNQQSDIYNQKGLNKPEIEYKHKRLMPKSTYSTTYNFLEWNDTAPHQNASIKIRQSPNYMSHIFNSNISNFQIYKSNHMTGPNKHNTFYERLFQNDPDFNTNRSEIRVNARYQRETLNLGNYPGYEYKIKKNKSVIYDPKPYFADQNPLKQKLDLIYGGCDNLIGNYKPALNRSKRLNHSASSIGYAHRSFETRNEHDPNITNNAKKMKYFSIYGNKGIENANKKLKPISLTRSTNNAYIPGEYPIINKVNFLKSNIFNDKDVEKINNEDYEDNTLENDKIKVNRKIDDKKLKKRTKSANIFPRHINNSIHDDINIENHSKKFIYKQNEEKLPKKLKWNDPQLYLYFPQNKNVDILKKSARQRKFNNIYGADPISPKEKLCEEFKSDNRPEIEQAAKNNYTNMNYSQMKRISDNISQMQGNKFINENNNYKKNRNYKSVNKKKNNDDIIYEIKTKRKKRNIPNYEIEKKFAEKGIHIYDIRENIDSVFHNKNTNRISFKIRDNNKDGNFDVKINRIKEELLNDKELIMNEKNINKKKGITDIMPHDLKWNNPYCNLLTKNLNADKSMQGKTHSKPPLNRKNEDDKITRIFVNLKYKNMPYNA